MLLSICIPTHHGRDWSLKVALDSIIDQIENDHLADCVEVCISNNASHDETGAIAAAAQVRAPKNIIYDRRSMDVGSYNFVSVVRMAHGKFCWYLGSDDALEPGALRAVLDAINRHPNCAGISTYYQNYDSTLTHPVANHPDSLYPSNRTMERTFTTFEEGLAELGPSFTFMSTLIFRKQIWDDVLAVEPSDYIHQTRHHLHSYLLLQVLRRHPEWVWLPVSTVRARSDNASVTPLVGHRSYTHALMVLSDMSPMWSRFSGDDRETYRRTMRKAYRVHWSPAVVRHTKMLARHEGCDDWKMLTGYTRYLASLPDFWWGSFLALLIPHWFWKATLGSKLVQQVKQAVRQKPAASPALIPQSNSPAR
ncbi:MAG: glycosyltransferase [Capsulimonadaceae bacterium]|nr:glycosyltransferase [Capsulimonadaceae bacterium]